MQPKNLKKLNRLLYLLNILDGGEIRVPREDGTREQGNNPYGQFKWHGAISWVYSTPISNNGVCAYKKIKYVQLSVNMLP